MKITCTAPNGAKFEGQAQLWTPTSGAHDTMCSLHNSNERSALQKALETWCSAMGAKPEEAKVAA